MNGKLMAICLTAGMATLLVGCQNATTNTANANSAVVNSSPLNINASPAISPAVAVSGQTIETNEPNEYGATLELKAETVGGERAATPALKANVARSGEKRRVAFYLPNKEQIVYLNLGDKRYLIMPNRRQYAELDANAVGFEIPRLMMPDQIIEYLKGRTDYRRVGEEQFKGRAVVKYRADGATQTGTNAGQISGESFTYVDKETGLPLRAEFSSRAEGDVRGVRGVNAVVEMRDIKTETADEVFEVPNGYEKITAEQVRSQINTVTQIVAAIAGAFMSGMNNAATPTPR